MVFFREIEIARETQGEEEGSGLNTKYFRELLIINIYCMACNVSYDQCIHHNVPLS